MPFNGSQVCQQIAQDFSRALTAFFALETTSNLCKLVGDSLPPSPANEAIVRPAEEDLKRRMWLAYSYKLDDLCIDGLV